MISEFEFAEKRLGAMPMRTNSMGMNRYSLGYGDHPYRYLTADQMGSWLSDWTGVNIDVGKALQDVWNAIVEGFKHIGAEIGKIDWNQVGQNLSIAFHFIGNILAEINPIHLIYMGLKTCPLTGHMFMELDKFTGGFFTSLDHLTTLPARAMRGDAISKTELLDDALLGIKIVAVVASGGSAAAIISQSSSQLSKGTLGQTQLGRALLTVGGAVAGAIATDAAASAAAEAAGEQATQSTVVSVAIKSTETVVLGAAKTEIIKSSSLGQTELGQLAIGAGFAAGGGELVGGGAVSGLSSFAQSTAIQKAAQATPGGGQVAGFLIDNAGNIVSGTDFSNVSLPSFDIAQLPGAIAQAIQNISIPPVSDILGSIDLNKISFSTPTITTPEINIGQIPDIKNAVGIVMKVISRQKKVVKGRSVIHYIFADGSQADYPDTTGTTTIPPAVLIGGGLLLMMLLGDS